MQHIQKDLSPPARIFSKAIHNRVVERTSDFVGSTIARPNSITSGALFAFLAVLGVYLLAKQIGFSLSGFETIGAFAVGWVVGIIFDLLVALFKGRR